MMRIMALGQYLPHACARSLTIDAFVLNRSSRVIPVFNSNVQFTIWQLDSFQHFTQCLILHTLSNYDTTSAITDLQTCMQDKSKWTQGSKTENILAASQKNTQSSYFRSKQFHRWQSADLAAAQYTTKHSNMLSKMPFIIHPNHQFRPKIHSNLIQQLKGM